MVTTATIVTRNRNRRMAPLPCRIWPARSGPHGSGHALAPTHSRCRDTHCPESDTSNQQFPPQTDKLSRTCRQRHPSAPTYPAPTNPTNLTAPSNPKQDSVVVTFYRIYSVERHVHGIGEPGACRGLGRVGPVGWMGEG